MWPVGQSQVGGSHIHIHTHSLTLSDDNTQEKTRCYLLQTLTTRKKEAPFNTTSRRVHSERHRFIHPPSVCSGVSPIVEKWKWMRPAVYESESKYYYESESNKSKGRKARRTLGGGLSLVQPTRRDRRKQPLSTTTQQVVDYWDSRSVWLVLRVTGWAPR